MEKYKIEIQNYDNIIEELEKNKKILANDFSELFRYQNICTDSTQIYKWCSKLFALNNLYIFPIDYLCDLVKEFYKNKFGIYKELKTTEKNENYNQIIESKSESFIAEQKSENSHEEGGEEEGMKIIENDIPTYNSDNSIEFVIFIYNKISKIYEPTKRKLLLLILLLNALNNREENSNLLKQLLYGAYRIVFKGQLDEEKYNFNSPIEHISDKKWNSLKQISEACSFCFSFFLDDIESHKKEWEIYLENEEMIVSSNFTLNNDNLESCFSPLTKFIFFSIIKPHLVHSLIDIIIRDILKSEENFQKELCLNNRSEYSVNLKVGKNFVLEDLFKENMSITRKPIVIFEVENGFLCLEKELKDHYLKKMKTNNTENNVNNNINNVKQEGNPNEHIIHYKEIIPSKLELSNVEFETIHNSMKSGGLIVIKNPLLIEESLIKILEEFQDKNTAINDNFKLILLVKNNNLLPKFIYTSTNIIHNDFIMFTQIKEYIINLIKETPIDLYNKFMNCDLHNMIMFHMKKIYIYFLIINALLIQYIYIHSKIYKIPIDFCKMDFILILKFIEHYLSSINEEKIKALIDPDNNFGFNFDSIIKIILDSFINARLIYREDEENVNKMLSQFFDGEQFLRENNNYFNYNDFVVPKIDEKLYPKKREPSQAKHEEQVIIKHSNKNIPTLVLNYNIPKHAVIELFENIPNEKYYNLLYGVSNEMIQFHNNKITNEFYDIFSKNDTKESLELENNINNDIYNNLPEIINLNSENIFKSLEKLNNSLPDQLNTADANPVLFKVNKFTELFNPLDECLKKEIERFNNFISNIVNDINNINMIFQGDIILNDKYYNILNALSKNLLPNYWKKSKYLSQDVQIDYLLNIIKYIYETINNWITNGSLPLYDLSTLYNAKLFIITLPSYFQKKLSENTLVSSDKIIIEYKLTNYEKIEEINETIIEKLKKQNGNKDFILIKGLKLRNFESIKDKDSIYFQENLNKKEGVELPIILVTYSINSLDNFKELQMKESDEESEEEENTNKNFSTKKSQLFSEISKYESQSHVKEDEEEELDEVKDISEFSMPKKHKFMHSKSSNYSLKTTKKYSSTVSKQYKLFTLKKYCKINVPFIDQLENEIYGLEEPLGFIELKIKCTDDKQEEYFVNNKLHINIDN